MAFLGGRYTAPTCMDLLLLELEISIATNSPTEPERTESAGYGEYLATRTRAGDPGLTERVGYERTDETEAKGELGEAGESKFCEEKECDGRRPEGGGVGGVLGETRAGFSGVPSSAMRAPPLSWCSFSDDRPSELKSSTNEGRAVIR